MNPNRCSAIAIPALLVGLLALAGPARAWEAWDGRAALHGFWETQLRALSDDFEANGSYVSQFAHVLNLEAELDLAPEGAGPFDLVQAFARIEARYECLYTGCGVSSSHRHFGDRAEHAPAKNWTTGLNTGFRGDQGGFERKQVHGSTELRTAAAIPLLEPLIEAGGTNIDATFGPAINDVFAYRKLDGSRDSLIFLQGPWQPSRGLRSNGNLRGVPNPTLPLPLRPAVPQPGMAAAPGTAEGLYVPSPEVRRLLGSLDRFDQNFSETELAWNHGGGQDENELKELYVDLELFDGRLWLRLGKQNIVWGKTELFRTSDQWNPQDIALASLPSLEESRLAQWSARAVYSLYDVGPFSDVRVELAATFDDFEPIDIGRCGEPYTVFLACGKTAGLWTHGMFGSALAGELRPDDPWHSTSGIEVGARLEWRSGRFSFALTDFWGYDDAPVLERFNGYERNVDPFTGRPLDSRGQPLTPANALEFHPGNRQIFDFFCSITVGVAEALLPELTDRCLVDLPNASAMLGPSFLNLTPAEVLGAILAGTTNGEFLAQAASMGVPIDLVELDRDIALDGDGTGFFANPGSPADATLAGRLTDEQEALFGCGAFYGTDCDTDGIDIFNAEASALAQSFPQVDPDAPVATRFVDGQLVILPGARGPGDPGYDPAVDGTPPAGFDSEMAALSANFALLLVAFEIGAGRNPDCSLATITDCEFLRAITTVTGVQRPEVFAGGNGRMGRRDFLWHSGGEGVIRYPKRNVLGFSADFAEDRTQSNWSVEFSWVKDQPFVDNRSPSGLQDSDVLNLTISADRPTFINFLNANRTFFINSQIFMRWITRHDRSFNTNGPLAALGTLTVATGYFQDRLLPAVTWVHDLRSASGGAIAQVSYRFDQDFSASFGAAIFYGGPEKVPTSLFPLVLSNAGFGYNRRLRYEGLSAIAERDELFLRIRYTF